MRGAITLLIVLVAFQASLAQSNQPFEYEVESDNTLGNQELAVFSYVPGQPMWSRICSFIPDINGRSKINYNTQYYHQPTVGIAQGANMNIISLDIDGDKYDEIVEAHEITTGILIGVPFINRGNLTITSVPVDTIVTGSASVPGSSSKFKLVEADFDQDGIEEFVIAYRNYSTNKLTIEIRSVDVTTHQTTILAMAAVDSFYTAGSGGEALDITVEDFNLDGKPDIAVSSLEPISGSILGAYVRVFEVNTTTWSLVPGGKTMALNGGTTTQLANLSIHSGKTDPTDLETPNIIVGLQFLRPNLDMVRQIQAITTGTGVSGLQTVVKNGTGWRDSVSENYLKMKALSIRSGDLTHDFQSEVVFASNDEIMVFSMDMTKKWGVLDALTISSFVNLDFGEVVGNNSFLAIGDIDFDYINDIIYVVYPITGGPFGGDYVPYAKGFGLSKGSNLLVEKVWRGVGVGRGDETSRYAVTLGEFRGGVFKLREPNHYVRQVLKPIVINNTPPHHFDIFDTLVADITNCFPLFSCNMNSEYKEAQTTSSTLTTNLKSDWALSGEVAGMATVYGVPMQVSLEGYYGKEFSKTSTSQNTVQISTVSVANGDDQIFAVLTNYDVYEYPLDSCGVTVGYIISTIQAGTPIIQWMDSKSTDAFGYFPTHEVGNIMSYPSNSNFDNYVGNIQTIKEMQVGYNVGSGGTMNFGMTFTDFTTNSADSTQKYGIAISAEVGDVDKLGIGVKVKGEYNNSQLTSHTSEAKKEISYNSNLITSLNPNFNDANYTITPKVYWSSNGAITLGYAVDPSIPPLGLNNFWKDHYSTHPDLTLILPWKFDPEKGYSLGSTPDKRRLCKSIKINAENFDVGDTVKIVAFVHNYSFVDHSGPVEFQFFIGPPDGNGIQLQDINGNSTITVNDTFPGRSRTRVEFDWQVSVSSAQVNNIYVSIDPNEKITEIHEDNNIGYYPMGGINNIGLEEQSLDVVFDGILYPNPNPGDHCQLNLTLPNSGHLQVSIHDLQGRKLQTSYSDHLRRGNYILPLQVQDLPDGMYLVRMEFKGKMVTRRMIIMR